MKCENCQSILLDLGWTADERVNAAEMLRHLEQCDVCRATVEQFDRIQDQLKPPTPAPDPTGGWDQFERRLLDAVHSPKRRWLPEMMRLAAAFLVGILAIEAYRWTSTTHPPTTNEKNAPTTEKTSAPKPTSFQLAMRPAGPS